MYVRKQVLNEIEALFELDQGTLEGEEQLAVMPQWDSLGMIGIIAMLDAKFRTRVTFEALTACKTTGDLCRLLGDKLDPG
jgi:acyl carrier protein